MNHRAVLALATLSLLASCRATSKEAQIEAVAKDWSMTIRASQVMPVYPLTEDIQPGDVFLVQLPIDRQQAVWKKSGFLPLDNHVGRIDPSGYQQFYDYSFLADVDPNKALKLPATWRASKPEASPNDRGEPAWSDAPRAAFPSYSFSVKRSGGLNVAIPISGIPVALGVLGTDAAEGAVSLANARTLGVDQASLFTGLKTWASENQPYLANYAPRDGRVNYLRIVNRIYLVGKVDISVRDASSRSVGVDVAEPKPVAAQMVATPKDAAETPETAVKNYDAALTALNGTLDRKAMVTTLADGTTKLLPGGSLRFTSVSARTVSMSEEFDPPLVIGYLGFDVAIGEFGAIGPPVPTFSVVDYGMAPAAAASSSGQLTANSRMQTVARAIKQMAAGGDAGAKDFEARLDKLGELVPPQWPCTVYNSDGTVLHASGATLRKEPPTYEAVSSFRGGLITTIENVEAGIADDSFRLADAPAVGDAKAFARSRLAMSQAELRWFTERLQPYAKLLAEADQYTAPYQQKK